MTETLVVGMGGVVAGTIVNGPEGPWFDYDDEYRRRAGATPLSISLPLSVGTHMPDVVLRWLWGLLPDDSDVLKQWAREFEVPSNSPFALLGTPVGEDCAGAVQFVSPDRADEVLSRRSRTRWLTDAQVAQRLRDLRRDTTSWLGADFTGQFSLGGAQAKTALHFDGKRWGAPSGATPTTHILKPAIVGLDDHDLNEHLCMEAAARLGLIVSRSNVTRFDEESALVIERYDRVRGSGGLTRVHQEDVCQALGTDPGRKYQFEGGPGPGDIAGLMRAVMSASAAEDAVWRFFEALAWNWVIAGTDAHARNYSLLLSGGQVRLAPLYDIASALPYPGVDAWKLKTAMKLGGEYRLKAHGPSTWPKVAAELALDADDVVSRVRELVDGAPDALADAAQQPAVRVLKSAMPARLVDAVADRVEHCRGQLPRRKPQ